MGHGSRTHCGHTLYQFKEKSKTGQRYDMFCGVKASEAKISLLYKYVRHRKKKKNYVTLSYKTVSESAISHGLTGRRKRKNFAGIIQRLNLVSLDRPIWILTGELDLLLITALATCFDISKFLHSAYRFYRVCHGQRTFLNGSYAAECPFPVTHPIFTGFVSSLE
jgi:hypothetical protein